MYKGLQLQPTFIYTECSDVTEVFVTESEIQSSKEAKRNTMRKTRFKMAPIRSDMADDDDTTPPRLCSSATSIMKRPSSTLMRHSSLSNHERTRKSVANEEFHVRDKFEEGIHWNNAGDDEISRRTQLKILRDLSEAKRARERRTEFEFLQFAKEFAKKCRSRPMDNLLNPVQYENYLRKTPPQNSSVPNFPYLNKYDFSVCSKIPFVRSSSLAGVNNEETLEVAGHVVGDLLSFTTNTARY